MDKHDHNLTKPDGKTETLGPFQSDDAGGYTTTYSPAATGDYSAVMYFPGEKLTGSQGNVGFPNAGNINVNDTYGASTSNTVHFTVGEETVSVYLKTRFPPITGSTPCKPSTITGLQLPVTGWHLCSRIRQHWQL